MRRFGIAALLVTGPWLLAVPSALAVPPDPPSCTAADRGISSFSCPGTPTGNICGVAPNYTCYAPASEPSCSGGRVFNCNSCACACPGSQIFCNGSCIAPPPNTCAPGQTYSVDPVACTTVCTGYGYALVGTPALAVPQAGFINVTGGYLINGAPISGGGGGGGIGGIGLDNYIAKFLTTSTLTTSVIYEDAGRIGIGTIIPTHKLHVAANIAADAVTAIQNSSAEGYSAIGFYDQIGGIRSYVGWSNTGAEAVPGTAFFGTAGSDPLIFTTGLVERMRVDGAGNVGIRTSAPGFPLSVGNVGGTAIVNTLDTTGNVWTGYRIERPAGSEKWFMGVQGDPGSNNNFIIRRNSATNDLTIDTTGKVTVNSFQVTGGAAVGRVLTSDVSGNATWQAPGAVSSCSVAPTQVAVSTGTTTGSGGGYSGMNSLCSAQFGAGSHVCTPDEIFAAKRCSSIPASGQGWIANGGPGYTSPSSNDCNGWQSNGATIYGDFWVFDGLGGIPYATSCNQATTVICCK